VGTDSRVVVFLDEQGMPPVQRFGGYDPLAEENLLTRFTRLAHSSDQEVVCFYRDFGPLGWPAWHIQKPYGWQGWSGLRGEPVWWLMQQVRELCALMELYYALQNRNDKGLRLLLEPLWQSQDGLPRPAPRLWLEEYMFRVGAGLRPNQPDPPQPGLVPMRIGRKERVWWAEFALKAWVDRRLATVSRVVSIPQPQPWRKDAAKEAARPFVPRWRFSCLLEALYLHFYDIVTGNGELRRCPNCVDLYPAPIVQRGRAKVYCSRRCQNAANKRAQRRTLSGR
jgi:hypothetical protein